MNIKPMLARLQSAMGRDNLTEQMILLPEPKHSPFKGTKAAKSINLVVGYNGSPRSQTALDITLWIAHQTRLVSQKEVTVQVVYVLDEHQKSTPTDIFTPDDKNKNNSAIEQMPLENIQIFGSKSVTSVLTHSLPRLGSTVAALKPTQLQITSVDPLEKADHILWQARCLAEEWRGSFKAHLRFGCVAAELRKVVEAEAATLLFLGCNSANHAIVKKLGHNFPCSVLGLPSRIDE